MSKNGYFEVFQRVPWTEITRIDWLYHGNVAVLSGLVLSCISFCNLPWWFHMRCLFCHYLSLISPSLSSSGRSCFLMLAFPGHLHLCFFGICNMMPSLWFPCILFCQRRSRHYPALAFGKRVDLYFMVFYIQSTLAISISLILNDRLFRSENLVPV